MNEQRHLTSGIGIGGHTCEHVTIHAFDAGGEFGDIVRGGVIAYEAMGAFGMGELEFVETVGSAADVIGGGWFEVDVMDGEVGGLNGFSVFEEFNASSKVGVELRCKCLFPGNKCKRSVLLEKDCRVNMTKKMNSVLTWQK